MAPGGASGVEYVDTSPRPYFGSPEPLMKIVLSAGLVLIVLGIASLLVPIPRTEMQGIQGIKAGDVNIEVQTTHSERVSPIISAVLIAGGIAVTVLGARMRLPRK